MAEIANLNTRLSLESASFISGVERSRGALRSLIASLDPVAAATARYNRNVQLLENGLKRGTLSVEQHGVALQRLNARYNEQMQNQASLTGQTGVMRAGMQQLSFQLGDVATQFASGTRPMVIFAQQGSQVIQAIQMMSNSSKGLLGFLAGPWGQAFTAAAIVVSALTARLNENAEASEGAEMGANALADAQSALGQIFDLTSGKLKNQNELLIVNARLMAANLRAEALTKRAGARETLIDAQRFSMTALEAQTVGIGGLGDFEGQANARAVTQLLRSIGTGPGQISRADAIRRAEGMDFTGTGTTRQKFQEALRDATVANLNERVATMIDQSLDSGTLAAGLREPGKDTKGRTRSGMSAAEIQRRFEDQLDDFRSRIASANGQLAISAEEEAELAMRGVEWARRETERSIEADENFSDTQKKRLKLAAEELAEAERQVVEFRMQRRLEQEAQQLEDERYRAQVDSLRADLELADTEQQRKDLILRIFDVEQAFLKSRLEQLAASETATKQERKRAQMQLDAVNSTAGSRRAAAERASETEVERYLRELNRTPEQINEAFDRIKLDGLDALNEGLVDAITGVKSLGDVFEDVTGQIIADLARIAIQKYITFPLAQSLFGGAGGSPTNLLAGTAYGGGGGGLLAGLGRLFRFAGGGSFQVGGMPGIDRNLMSINGEPVAMVSSGEFVNVSHRTPANDRGLSVVEIVDTTGLFRFRVNGQIAEAAPSLMAGGAAVARSQSARSNKWSLTG
jgi:hypothetical protein